MCRGVRLRAPLQCLIAQDFQKQSNCGRVEPGSGVLHVSGRKIGLRLSIPILADPEVHSAARIGLETKLDFVLVKQGEHFGKSGGLHAEKVTRWRSLLGRDYLSETYYE